MRGSKNKQILFTISGLPEKCELLAISLDNYIFQICAPYEVQPLSVCFVLKIRKPDRQTSVKVKAIVIALTVASLFNSSQFRASAEYYCRFDEVSRFRLLLFEMKE